MTRRLVDVDTLAGRLGDRRRILEASLAHTAAAAEAGELADVDTLEREALRHSLAELSVVASLLADLDQVPDLAAVDRPGVLLLGAGTSGRTVIEADRETLNLDLLSDRDLAVYTGLLGWVLDRLRLEQAHRTWPVRHLTGLPAADPQEQRA